MRLDCLHLSPVHRLVYVNNQKSGCTTIKYSLWQDHDRRTGARTFGGKTHDRVKTPFVIGRDALRGEGEAVIAAASVFTVVRSPFSRTLSAYLHHVNADGFATRLSRRFGFWRSQSLRDDIMGKLGLPRSHRLSFAEFLDALAARGQLDDLTGHFRSQVQNTLWGELAYDFVGRMEDMGAVNAFLAQRDIPLLRRTPHAQKAGQKLEDHYTPTLMKRVHQIYREDFEAFGYDPDTLNQSAAEITLVAPSTAKPIVNLVFDPRT